MFKVAVLFFLLFGVFLGTASDGDANSRNYRGELIVLAAPLSGDPYYADMADKIFNFHVEFARQIKRHNDSVLILVDEENYEKYVNALGRESVAIYPMADIWMRDFGLSNAANPVLFRYTAAAQGGGLKGQREADAVQHDLVQLLSKAGVQYRKLDLLNDGGNLVDDYAGNAVLSNKFLRDNNLTESAARKLLRERLNLKNVAFIDSDEQGGLEHADGVVSFVDENTLVINSYDDHEYSQKLVEDLKRGLPGVRITKVVTPYDDSSVYDERFGSACGLYTNALVTPDRIYLPQFGIPEDEIARKCFKEISCKEIVPVFSSEVCLMGGGVRCMSWQLRGTNARNLLEYFDLNILSEE
ncbi:agmatine deiminase family protein [Maridesulfovibrio sp.]|uniref:agmatine deiminase family protein n=1 Tax=Maridesulfovibrio sp. TaxID=2795000 RepID=UPI003BAB374E